MRATRRVELSRNDMPRVACADLIIYGDDRAYIMQGRYDQALAFHATKIAEILAMYYDGQCDPPPIRAELLFDGRFIAFKIEDVTVTRDTERPGL